MPKLTIYDRKGKKVGTYNVEPTDFAPRINKQLLHDAVVMYQANMRQGSHQTKSRGMVAGSTKKMYRQKGTGNARAGSKRSGIRRGGGHIHRIHNRDYSYRLPRKALQTGHADGAGREGAGRRIDGDRRPGACRTADQGHGRDFEIPRLSRRARSCW